MCIRDRAQGQAFQEIAQDLVATGAVMLVSGLAEQGRQFRLGQREASGNERVVHVHVLQLESHAQFLQHQVVGDACFHGARWQAFVATAIVEHQAIKEVRQYAVTADHRAFLAIALQQLSLIHI